MATIGGITVRFDADVKGYISDVNRASKITGNAGDKMSKALKVAGAAMATAATAATAAVTKMAADTLREADRFQKLGIAIGVSTEALSQLDFVAQQSGTSFDVVEKSLVRLQKSVMDSNNGLATQTRAFEAIGVSAQALQALKPEEQFMMIAEAASAMGASTERTGALADIFGQRMAKDIIPMLDLGAEGMQRLMNEADAMGLTISQDFADDAALFNDSMNKINNMVTGFGRQLTAALLPTLQHLYDSFINTGDAADHAARAGEFLSNVLKALVTVGLVVKNLFEALSHVLVAFGGAIFELFTGIKDAIAQFIGPLTQAVQGLVTRDFGAVTAAVAQMKGVINTDLTQAGKNAKAIFKDQMGEAAFDLGQIVDGVNKIWDEQADTIKQDVIPATRDLAKRSGELYDEQNDTAEAAADLAEALDAQAKAAEETARWIEELRREADPAAAAAADYAEEVRRLTDEFMKPGGAIESQEEMTELLEALEQRHFPAAGEAAAEAADTMTVEWSEASTIMDQTVRSMNGIFTDFFQDLISGSGNAFENLKKTAINALGQIISTYAQNAISLNFQGGAGGAGGGMGGLGGMFGGGSGGMGGGLMNGLRGMFGQTQGQGWNWGFGTNQGGFNNSAAGAAVGVIGGSAIGGMIDNGDRIGGFDYAGTGAMVGAIIGSIIPVIGTLVGGLIGGALGGLFGKFFGRNFEGTLGGSNRPGADANDAQFETAFGTVYGLRGQGGFGHTDEEGSYMAELAGIVTEFDATLASFLTADQLGRVTEAFKDWEVSVNSSATATEDILGSRFDVVLNEFPDMVKDFVNQFDGLEKRTEAFEKVVRMFNLMQQSITAFVDSDPAAEIEAALRGPQQLTRSLLTDIGNELRAAMEGFDGTPEAMAEVAVLMDKRYQAELQYLRTVAMLIQEINQSVAAQRQQLEDALKGEQAEATFDQIVGQISGLISSLATAEGPEEIARIVSDAQGLIDTAFGQLNQDGVRESTRRSGIEQLLELLNALEAQATGRLDDLASDVTAEGDNLRSEAQEFADAFGIELTETTAAVNDTTNAVDAQTGVIIDEHGNDREVLAAVVQKLGDIEQVIRDQGGSVSRVGFVSG